MGLLPSDSAHSKLVQRGVQTALNTKSCTHKTGDSFENLTTSANNAGYPVAFATNACESFVQKAKGKKKLVQTQLEPNKMHAIPYFHRSRPMLTMVQPGIQGTCCFLHHAGWQKYVLCLKRKRNQAWVRQETCTHCTDCVCNVVDEIALSCGR